MAVKFRTSSLFQRSVVWSTLVLAFLVSLAESQSTYPGTCPERTYPNRKYGMSKFQGIYYEVMSNIEVPPVRCTVIQIKPFSEGVASLQVAFIPSIASIALQLNGTITIQNTTMYTGEGKVFLTQLGTFEAQAVATANDVAKEKGLGSYPYYYFIGRICSNNKDNTYTEKIFVLSKSQEVNDFTRKDIVTKLQSLGLQDIKLRALDRSSCPTSGANSRSAG